MNNSIPSKELQRILLDIISAGKEIRIGHDFKGDFYVNLDTQAKSDCILSDGPDGIVAEMRYGKTQLIETYEDVLYTVRECRLGRSYMSHTWETILKQKGLL